MAQEERELLTLINRKLFCGQIIELQLNLTVNCTLA